MKSDKYMLDAVSRQRGVVLLVVLLVTMAAAAAAIGFLARSDVELSCGQNMILRTQVDYLAESGLQHAKGILLQPQDIDAEYWGGEGHQQLVAGSDGYYDVTVARDTSDAMDRCNYTVTSSGYRKRGGQKTGECSLQAKLRIHPFIAYWQVNKEALPSAMTVYGDVYYHDTMDILGEINGDAYASDGITGTAVGQQYAGVSSPPVSLPGISEADYAPYYYIDSSCYTAAVINTDTLQDITLGPSSSNPAGLYYRDGNLSIDGNVVVHGTLVVKGNLQISGAGKLNEIVACKNFPALWVAGDLKIEEDDSKLDITGYAQIGHHIDMKHFNNAKIDVLGALYVLGNGVKNADGSASSVTIRGAPIKASLEIWRDESTLEKWSPAGGAFFKSINRD